MNTLSSLLKFIGNRLKDIQYGRAGLGTITANSYKDTEVTFDREFLNAPLVFVDFNYTGTAPSFGSFQVCAINITTTGFTIRAFNNTNTDRSPSSRWVAIG